MTSWRYGLGHLWSVKGKVIPTGRIVTKMNRDCRGRSRLWPEDWWAALLAVRLRGFANAPLIATRKPHPVAPPVLAVLSPGWAVLHCSLLQCPGLLQPPLILSNAGLSGNLGAKAAWHFRPNAGLRQGLQSMLGPRKEVWSAAPGLLASEFWKDCCSGFCKNLLLGCVFDGLGVE